jgi:DNA-3-methyladenine glycosylase II
MMRRMMRMRMRTESRRGGERQRTTSAAQRHRPSLAETYYFRRGYDHIRKNDPRLRPILDARGVLEFKPEGNPFESLVESILSQQLAGTAASAIIRKVRALFPDGELEPERIHSIDPEQLRAAGVSPQKLGYLRDLSARVLDKRLELYLLESMPDEEVIEVLDKVKGIGPWTAHMFLIFNLGRPNILPVDDYGIRASMQTVYGLAELPKPVDIERLAERWHPFCSVASLYLWRARDKED